MLRELARQMRAQRIASVYVLGTRGDKARAFFEGAGFRPLHWNVYLQVNR